MDLVTAHVEYQTKGGQGLIVSTDTSNNTIILSDTGDRDNRWIAYNKLNTDFFVTNNKKLGDSLFYVERTGEVIEEQKLYKSYGLNKTNCNKAGIFKLTERPEYTPKSYIRTGNGYAPVYDYESIVDGLVEELRDLKEVYDDSVSS